MQTFKNFVFYDSIARLNFPEHCQLFGISPICTTLVLACIFPLDSICQFFCHIFFYIVVYLIVTLDAASEMHQRHNK